MNFQITQGTGTIIATDTGGGSEQYQKIKLIDATPGSTAGTGIAANPLQISLEFTNANTVPLLIDGSGVTQPVSGTVIANAGTGNFTVVQSVGTSLHTNVDNFPVSQTVNGTIAATQSGSWTVSLSTGSIEIGTVDQGTPNTLSNAWPVELTDGTDVLGTSTHPIRVDPTGTTTQPISGSVSVSNFPVTQPISGTITANQGTSPWIVSGSVSVSNASIAVTQSGVWSVGRTWTLASGTDSISAVQSGTWNINNISGTVSLPTGAATEATLAGIKTDTDKFTFSATRLLIDGSGVTQPISGSVSISNFPATTAVTQSTSPWVVSGTVTANIGTTNGLALDASVTGLQVSQGSTTSGQKGELIQGAVTTAAPSYTTGQTSPLSLTTVGALRVDIGTSTLTVNQGTSPWVVSLASTTITGSVAVTGPLTDTQLRASAVPVSLASTTITGTVAVTQSTSPWVVSGTVTANIGTSGSLALDASVVKLNITQGTALGSNTGPMIQGSVTTTSPTYTTGQISPLSLTTSGALRTDSSATTQPVSGTVTANAGTGSFTVAQATGTNLHIVLDSGTLTSITNALPAGTNVIGHVITDTGSTTAVTGNVTVVQTTASNLNATVVGAVSLGTSTGKSVVMKTGSLVTTATTADQVVLTYTVTSGKTFYVEYVDLQGSLTTPSNTNTVIGTISLETPSGTKVISARFTNSSVATQGFDRFTFSEPVPVAAATVIRAVTTPGVTTSITWLANFGGYEI